MIVDLPDTTTSKVSKEIMALREQGGVIALGRVLTLVVVTKSGLEEEAIEAANEASREHPCRVIVLARGQRQAAPRLDAQIRVAAELVEKSCGPQFASPVASRMTHVKMRAFITPGQEVELGATLSKQDATEDAGAARVMLSAQVAGKTVATARVEFAAREPT